jgi:cytochrome c553
VERDKPNKSESLYKLCRSCHGHKKEGILKKIGFISSNFIKFYRNIHRSVWQLLGVEQIQNGGRCHGNQGAKNVKLTPYSGSF